MKFKPGLVRTLFESPLDWLLIALPAAFVIRYLPAWHEPTLLFFVSAAAIVPFAGWIGRATEQLAKRAGHGVGGLLNATFGKRS